MQTRRLMIPWMVPPQYPPPSKLGPQSALSRADFHCEGTSEGNGGGRSWRDLYAGWWIQLICLSILLCFSSEANHPKNKHLKHHPGRFECFQKRCRMVPDAIKQVDVFPWSGFLVGSRFLQAMLAPCCDGPGFYHSQGPCCDRRKG